MNYWKLFVDGASRNNPGPSGAGIFLIKNGAEYGSYSFYLGKKTNNQAEYMALIFGLLILRSHVMKEDILFIASDSQLLVRQIEGNYRVKDENLRRLHHISMSLLSSFAYQIEHIMRDDNHWADELANKAIDDKVAIPTEYVTVLREYGVLCE